MTNEIVADTYDIPQLRRDLHSTRFGHPLEYRDRVTSTNDRILDMARRGAPEGTVALTEEQTAGRGRRGHSWFSPPGMGIWTSFLLRPRLPGKHLPPLTLCAAYAVASCIEENTDVDLCIKWPNDILINDRKVAGILAETKNMLREGPCVVVGIGINVNHTLNVFPDELKASATSLRMVKNEPISRQPLFCKMVEKFESVYHMYLETGLRDILPKITSRLAWLGEMVEVNEPVKPTFGRIVEVNEDGSLSLETKDNRCIAIYSGTIRLIENA
jgi:BirA family transcriptional regulator, biotin operon repressor / biotin---[acetyl-CoA-carboxylase] ligase